MPAAPSSTTTRRSDLAARSAARPAPCCAAAGVSPPASWWPVWDGARRQHASEPAWRATSSPRSTPSGSPTTGPSSTVSPAHDGRGAELGHPDGHGRTSSTTTRAWPTSVHDWQYLGENVGVGYSDSSLEAAFYASAPHRANMLDARLHPDRRRRRRGPRQDVGGRGVPPPDAATAEAKVVQKTEQGHSEGQPANLAVGQPRLAGRARSSASCTSRPTACTARRPGPPWRPSSAAGTCTSPAGSGRQTLAGPARSEAAGTAPATVDGVTVDPRSPHRPTVPPDPGARPGRPGAAG